MVPAVMQVLGGSVFDELTGDYIALPLKEELVTLWHKVLLAFQEKGVSSVVEVNKYHY